MQPAQSKCQWTCHNNQRTQEFRGKMTHTHTLSHTHTRKHIAEWGSGFPCMIKLWCWSCHRLEGSQPTGQSRCCKKAQWDIMAGGKTWLDTWSSLMKTIGNAVQLHITTSSYLCLINDCGVGVFSAVIPQTPSLPPAWIFSAYKNRWKCSVLRNH